MQQESAPRAVDARVLQVTDQARAHTRLWFDEMRRRVIALEDGRVARDDRRGGYQEDVEA